MEIKQNRAVWNIQHSSVGFAIRFTGNVMQYSALSLNLVQYVQCPFFENACEGLMGVKGYLSAMWMEPLHSSSLVLRRSGEDESPVHQLHFHRCQVEKIQEASKAT